MAILLADQAGWHTTDKLDVPANVSPLALPAESPELDPVGNARQYFRQTCPSNRAFPNYQAILDACCRAWNDLIERPWKILPIGLREWASTGQHRGRLASMAFCSTNPVPLGLEGDPWFGETPSSAIIGFAFGCHLGNMG